MSKILKKEIGESAFRDSGVKVIEIPGQRNATGNSLIGLEFVMDAIRSDQICIESKECLLSTLSRFCFVCDLDCF
jgi:hypothetical protein